MAPYLTITPPPACALANEPSHGAETGWCDILQLVRGYILGNTNTVAPRIMLITTLVAALQSGSYPVDSAPIRRITQLVHTLWTAKVGGGPIGIRDLAHATDGYIRIGSFLGLWRFDGVRFVRYTSLGGDTIPDEAPRLPPAPGRPGERRSSAPSGRLGHLFLLPLLVG